MMPINFYKKGSPGQHKSIARWFGITTLMVIILMISCTSIHIKQSHTHATLNTHKVTMQLHYAQHESIATQYKAQHAARELLEKKSLKIYKHANNPKSPVDMLKSIKTSLNKNTHIEQICISGTDMHIKIAGDQPKALLQTADLLCGNAHPTLHIVALEHTQKNTLLATFHNYDSQKKCANFQNINSFISS